MPGYNEQNMKDASSGYQMGSGQKKMEDMVSGAWNKVKGLVGAGDDSDAMGTALSNRKKKLEGD